MFDTVLVANRGEIAVRIIRSARELGLRTVAVHSDADSGAPHVRLADRAVRLGPAQAAASYLRIDRLLEAAAETGAGAIHPGYGFLSERADFAVACAEAGIAFVGPTPEQLTLFGDKHTAREAARAAGVPMLDGTGLLPDVDTALAAAEQIGYPVMLKATAGGGGIGMQVCWNPDELGEAFARVSRLAVTSFGSGGVFLERFIARARHVEVQMFGDGLGRVVSLADRDCSLQRRNQKVLEEAPAPNLPDELREVLHRSARELAASVDYRSAGTVEFVVDAETGAASFLEVNTRLQVEHTITEEITGLDLVAMMLRLAGGETTVLDGIPDHGPAVTGHAVQARVYAEDPTHDYRPSAGRLTEVSFPAEVRVDSWIETGLEATEHYDPLLAKIVTTGADRAAAFAALSDTLGATRIHGIETNLGLLQAISTHDEVAAMEMTTSTLRGIVDPRPRIEVGRAGMLTTVQDLPGRIGHWDVGIPPSGPMDDLSFRLGNDLLGNPVTAAGLECTFLGPVLTFTAETVVAVTGAPAVVTLNGETVPQWQAITVPAGGTLDIGATDGPGVRTYLLVQGGLDIPTYLGSASTFTAGGFGGHAGRALRVGDVLRPGQSETTTPIDIEIPEFAGEPGSTAWQIAVQEGPQPAPDYLTDADLTQFYGAEWTVTNQSARTGVRLSGPKPEWARTDGGEAGLHPSNLHDNPYSVGAVNLTGDTPVLLGPDGPSLGGFVCPVTVTVDDRWKIGQLRPGDTIRFVPLGQAELIETENDTRPVIRRTLPTQRLHSPDADHGILGRREADGDRPAVLYRRGAEDNVLVEYGDMVLDLGLRMRIHALASALKQADPQGLIDITPGVRSLHLHSDSRTLKQRDLIRLLTEIEEELPATSALTVPSRTVHLPMSFDDPTVAEAIERYSNTVRETAPWNPSNIEFIRRINGLDSVEDVASIVFDAEYLVLGLGDVYLGAPAATPLDPRHRLVTTKYNPARTWTAEATVGIGGTYLCIYGMESPGGYQLIGRTVPIWNTYGSAGGFRDGLPWLLRFFDRISWYPVEPGELLDLRADLAAGRTDLQITSGEFALADHQRFLSENADSIDAFRTKQAAAFGEERGRWEAAGEFAALPDPEPVPEFETIEVPAGSELLHSPLAATVWQVEAAPGSHVRAGDPVIRLEAMKMEYVVNAPADGQVSRLLVSAGQQIPAGSPLVVFEPRSSAA